MMNEPTTPIISSTPVIPVGYVMHIVTTVCNCCGTVTNRSDFYALTYLRSRFGTGMAKQLTRCDAPLYNVPVERINVGTRRTPYCSDCLTIDLSHLPPPPQAANVYDLPPSAPKDARPKGAKPAPATGSKKATLGDLA